VDAVNDPSTEEVITEMEFDIKIVRGPLAQGFSKQAAAAKLESLPGFPANAQYKIEEIDGYYVAAVVSPKTAEFPPGSGDSEESGPPIPEAEESGPPSDEGESKPKKDKEDGPSSEGPPHGEDGKISVEHQLANLTDMLTKITDALGLSTPADSMIPGADEGLGGPPGLDGPPIPGEGTAEDPSMGKKPGVGSDNKMHTVHERSLKPGEAPPGTTPVGAPTFASVSDDHPWKAAIEAGTKEIEVESTIGDTPIGAVAAELKGLAEPYGYIVTDLAPSGVGEQRTASARIVRTR
jgi:hypothetical protein